MYQCVMTFRQIIAHWPTARELADDVGATKGAVKQWRLRDSIPKEYWLDVERAARRRGIEGVTIFVMAEAAAHEVAAQ